MKKTFMITLLIAIVVGIGLAIHKTNQNASKTIKQSKTSAEESINADIVITDNYFIQSTNDVYLNLDTYIGKTIKMEGLIYEYSDNSGAEHVAVVRNSPGCCGNDGLAGLDIEYNERKSVGTWVEVFGKIKETNIDNQRVPIIEVSSMVQKEAGKTFVTN